MLLPRQNGRSVRCESEEILRECQVRCLCDDDDDSQLLFTAISSVRYQAIEATYHHSAALTLHVH